MARHTRQPANTHRPTRPGPSYVTSRAAWLVLAAGLAMAGTPALAQSTDEQAPVYISDAPLAEEALGTVGAMLERGGTDEAVRLIQRVLDEQGDRLIAADEPGLFVPVRRRIHERLLADPALLGAYRARQTARARALLDAGDWRTVERAYWLTEPGSQAALNLSQVLVESAQFEAGLRELLSLEAHPDAPACAPRAADLAAFVASVLDTDAAWSLAARWAAAAGDQPPQRIRADRPAPRPDAARGALAWEGDAQPGPISLEGIVARALHEAELTELEPVDDATQPNFRGGVTRPDLPWAMPTIAGGSLLVSDGLTVSSFDRFTLRPRWRVHASDAPVEANTRALRSRVGRLVEDSTSVTVDGPDAFAALGLPRSGGDYSDARVARIDSETGRVRWAVTLGSLSPELEGAEPRGPIIVEGDLVIVGARKNQRSRRLVGLSIVGLDRATGALRWSRAVGSAGSLPFQQLTHLSEGGVLQGGVVYWTDKMGLVAAVETATGRARWVRQTVSPALDLRGTRVPFATSLPVITDQGLFVLTPDQAEIRLLDPGTGEVLHTRTAEPAGEASYLVRVGDWLACVGNRRVAFYDIARFADRTARLTDTLDSQAIRGRAVAMGDRLAVPIEGGLSLINPDGAVRIDHLDLETTGNIGIAEGHVIVIDESDVRSYLAWDTASEMLRARVEAGDLSAALALAELAHRSGHPGSVLGAIDDAIAIAAGDTEGRARTFEVIRVLTDPRTAQADGSSPVGLDLRGRLLDRLGRVARTGDQRVAHAMAVGGWRADRGDIEGAARAYQDILLDRPMARAIWSGGGLSVRAELEASRRLQELAERFGSAATGASDAIARDQARALAGSTDPAAWSDLARMFPASAEAPGAWTNAALAWADRERWTESERAARTGLRAVELAGRRGDTAPRAGLGELAGVLVRSLQEQGRGDEAGTALHDLSGRFGGVIEPTVRGRAVAVGPTIGAQRAVLGSTFVREARPTLLRGSPIATSLGALSDAVLTHAAQSGELAMHRVDDATGELVRLWVFGADTPAMPTLAHADEDRLVLLYPAMPELGLVVSAVTLDTRTGQVVWKADLDARIATIDPAHDDPGSNIEAQVIAPIEGTVANRQVLGACDGRTLFVTDRRGRALGFDAATGRELWKGALGMSRVYGIDMGGGVVGVCGASVRGTDPNANEVALRGVGEVIDPRTGETVQMLEDLGSNTRWVRASPDGQIIIAASASIVAIDTLEGRVDWSNGDEVLMGSEDAWVLGEWLIVMGRGGGLWIVPRREGVRRITPMDTLGRSADRGWMSMERLGTRMVMHGSQGVVIFDGAGEFVAADGVVRERPFLVSAAGEGRTVLVERSYEDPDGRTRCDVVLIETETGRLLDRVAVEVPEGILRGPTSVALVDGRVVIGFNEVSMVLALPAEGGEG